MYLLHARFMLEFFASLNIIPAELSVMLDDRIYFQIGRMELFSSEHQTLLEQFRNKSSLFSACEFHERISAFETVLRDLGYGTTQLKSSSHILKALYLFLYRYGLGYHPEIAGIWFEEIRRTLGNSWKNWRRILRLFKQYTEEGIVLKGTRYTYRIDILVLWSSIFVTLMANKIGGLQFGIYRNCQISSRVFHTAVAALPLTKANRSDFE